MLAGVALAGRYALPRSSVSRREPDQIAGCLAGRWSRNRYPVADGEVSPARLAGDGRVFHPR